MHLGSLANHWFAAHVEQFQLISWTYFISKVTLRFETIGRHGAIAEFNKLKQLSTIKEYQEQYEALRTLVSTW